MAVTHPRPIKWQLEYLNQCSYMPVGDTCHYPTSILPVHCHEHSHTPFTSISAQCRLNSTLSILADTLALQFLGHSTFGPSSIQGLGGHPFLYTLALVDPAQKGPFYGHGEATKMSTSFITYLFACPIWAIWSIVVIEL